MHADILIIVFREKYPKHSLLYTSVLTHVLKKKMITEQLETEGKELPS